MQSILHPCLNSNRFRRVLFLGCLFIREDRRRGGVRDVVVNLWDCERVILGIWEELSGFLGEDGWMSLAGWIFFMYLADLAGMVCLVSFSIVLYKQYIPFQALQTKILSQSLILPFSPLLYNLVLICGTDNAHVKNIWSSKAPLFDNRLYSLHIHNEWKSENVTVEFISSTPISILKKYRDNDSVTASSPSKFQAGNWYWNIYDALSAVWAPVFFTLFLMSGLEM